jgi:hypothetical protein
MQRRNALERRNAMIPSMDIRKQFMFEHVRELQREAEQERMLAGQRKPYHSRVRYLIGYLSTFFVVPATNMQQLERQDQQAVCNCTRDKTPYSKDMLMIPQNHAEEQLNIAIHLETVVLEREWLVQYGFTPEEIVALLWLRQWYQGGGSDRVQLVRHWEFLKLLVRSGKLEV